MIAFTILHNDYNDDDDDDDDDINFNFTNRKTVKNMFKVLIYLFS